MSELVFEKLIFALKIIFFYSFKALKSLEVDNYPFSDV